MRIAEIVSSWEGEAEAGVSRLDGLLPNQGLFKPFRQDNKPVDGCN